MATPAEELEELPTASILNSLSEVESAPLPLSFEQYQSLLELIYDFEELEYEGELPEEEQLLLHEIERGTGGISSRYRFIIKGLVKKISLEPAEAAQNQAVLSRFSGFFSRAVQIQPVIETV